MTTGPITSQAQHGGAAAGADHVLVVAESAYPEIAAGARVRVVEMGAHLAPLGVDVDFRPTLSSSEYASIATPGVGAAKAIVLARGTLRAARAGNGNGRTLTLVHRLRSLVPSAKDNRPLDVYDFDDALYLDASASRRRRLGGVFKRQSTRCLRYMGAARLVLAGNRILADVALGRARRVEVVPSCVDPTTQPMRQHREVEVLTLGWTGSATTSRYLGPALEVVGSLHERGWPIRLILMGASVPIKAPWIEHRSWSLEAERQMLTEVDVGLMPLPDDPWARGKCGYKLLRYFSAGLPTIASPVGINAELLEGGGGLGPTSHAEWVAAIDELSRDVGMRKEIGVQAREFAEREYSYQVWAPRVAALLSELDHRR